MYTKKIADGLQDMTICEFTYESLFNILFILEGEIKLI